MSCTAAQCVKPSTHDGPDGRLCQHHYMAWRKYGYVGTRFAPVCTVEGCAARHTSGGYCSRHYKLMRATGSTDDRPRKNARKVCSIDGCDLGVEGHGLCCKHYTRMRRYGMTEIPPVPKPHPRLCAMCPNERPSNRWVYCSDECRERALYHVRRSTSRAAQLRRYGLTIETYDELLASQGGACAICLSTEPKNYRGRGESFAVDHDHATGAVRGLLCNPCNNGLGLFGDDPVRLRAAVDYLTRQT